MTHITLQSAFVLHLRPYRETSVLLDLFSEHYGRISAVAKGVRHNKSRVRALLQPFVPLLLSWYGKHELVNLSTIEMQSGLLTLQGDCLLSGFYLNELLMTVLQKHDPYPQLYTNYHQTLLELQGTELQPKILRLFEKKLLNEIGYALPFSKVSLPEKFYRFNHENGFECCDEATDTTNNIFLGKHLLAIANEDLSTDILLRDAKRLMRLALAPLLGNKQLQSRKLFGELHAAKQN